MSMLNHKILERQGASEDAWPPTFILEMRMQDPERWNGFSKVPWLEGRARSPDLQLKAVCCFTDAIPISLPEKMQLDLEPDVRKR